MKVELSAASPLQQKVDIIGIPCFEEDLARGARSPLRALVAAADRGLAGQLLQASLKLR